VCWGVNTLVTESSTGAMVAVCVLGVDVRGMEWMYVCRVQWLQQQRRNPGELLRAEYVGI